MDDFKKVKGVSLSRSIGEIQSVIDTFGDQLICVRIDDTDGSPLAIRAAICIEDNAWDFIAITTPAGRKLTHLTQFFGSWPTRVRNVD